MSDLDRLLAQVEELKKLANRTDDSWMDRMSNEELFALSQRVRRVADGLSGLQARLQGSVPQNPMKPLLPRRTAPRPAAVLPQRGPSGPAPAPPAPARPAAAPDLSNPMFRKQGASWQAPGPPAASPPSPAQPAAAPDLSNPMQRRRPPGGPR